MHGRGWVPTAVAAVFLDRPVAHAMLELPGREGGVVMDSRDPIKTTALPSRPCPSCGERIEAATGIGTPKPGDIVLCAYCRVFSIITDTLDHRVLSNKEWAALPLDQRERLTRLREGWSGLR
jgi:hypothetical protein